MIALDRVQRVDALEGMSRLPAESVDLICTDPPYNIASKNRQTIRHGVLMSTKEAWGRWDTFDPTKYEAWIGRVIEECFRLLKPGGALYMFTAREDNGVYLRRAVQAGFVQRNQIVMAKKNPLPSFTKNNWRSAFEIAFYCTKGKPRVFNFLSQAECVNVYHHPVKHRLTDHPTEKPLGLIKQLVLASSNPGDLVLDPFLGSGTTAVAAKQAGRRYLGFDTDPEYIRMARRRLRSAAVDNTRGLAA